MRLLTFLPERGDKHASFIWFYAVRMVLSTDERILRDRFAAEISRDPAVRTLSLQ